MSEDVLEYTQEDVDEAREELERTVVEVDWSYDAKLSNEQIDLLLAGKGDEASDRLWDNTTDYVFEMEWQAKEEIAEEYGIPVEELENSWPVSDLRFDVVINQSAVYLAVHLTDPEGESLEHLPTGWDHDYEDHEWELEVLGVNPHLMYKEWPDIPERTDPLIDPDELCELWDNLAFYYSDYMILLDGNAILGEAWKEGKVTSNVVKKGAMVTLHDYINGASSVEAWLRKDSRIDPSKIINDGGNHYGIQSCCGLYRGTWNGELTKEAK